MSVLAIFAASFIGAITGSVITEKVIMILKTRYKNKMNSEISDYEKWLKTQTKLDNYLRKYYNDNIAKPLKFECIKGGKKDV